VRLALLALLGSCAARPVLEVPKCPVPLTDAPPALPSPEPGAPDSASATFVEAIVRSGGREVKLGAWCRDGVWTTLDRRDARAFVVRESWGRLGERAPKRLARIEWDLVTGVVLRVKPERAGGIAFHAEISEGGIDPPRPVGTFEGVEISLPRPRRHGFRFSGSLRGDANGVVASWTPGVELRLAALGSAGAAPGPALRFRAAGATGHVVGEAAAAETFVEEWIPVPPVIVDAEGVKRADFRLQPTRRAAGFRPGSEGKPETYGGEPFAFELDG